MHFHNVSDVNFRKNFYGVTGVPYFRTMGWLASSNGSLAGHVSYVLSQDTPVAIDIDGGYDPGTRTGVFSVSATIDEALPAGTYKMYVTLTEDPVIQQGTQYDCFRQAFPSGNGTLVTFSDTYPQTVTVNGDFAMDYQNESGPYAGQWQAYDEANVRIVAWLQETSLQSKAVSQSANRFVSDLPPLTAVPGAAPAVMDLGRNYPNPFNPSTKIPVKVAETSDAVLEIVQVDGRRVTVLHEGPLEAGNHDFSWNGTDAQGNGVASGVYLARLITRAGSQSERLILLK